MKQKQRLTFVCGVQTLATHGLRTTSSSTLSTSTSQLLQRPALLHLPSTSAAAASASQLSALTPTSTRAPRVKSYTGARV